MKYMVQYPLLPQEWQFFHFPVTSSQLLSVRFGISPGVPSVVSSVASSVVTPSVSPVVSPGASSVVISLDVWSVVSPDVWSEHMTLLSSWSQPTLTPFFLFSFFSHFSSGRKNSLIASVLISGCPVITSMASFHGLDFPIFGISPSLAPASLDP